MVTEDTLTFRELAIADYDEVIELWRASEGIGLSAADTPERIGLYLMRNPGLSFVVRHRGQVVGALLCGHDGRRGYLHHLAVRPEWRHRGIGSALVALALKGLREEGIDKCHLFVKTDNQAAKSFWKNVGWKERVDLVVMSRDII
jgi:putative acetyltransferase